MTSQISQVGGIAKARMAQGQWTNKELLSQRVLPNRHSMKCQCGISSQLLLQVGQVASGRLGSGQLGSLGSRWSLGLLGSLWCLGASSSNGDGNWSSNWDNHRNKDWNSNWNKGSRSSRGSGLGCGNSGHGDEGNEGLEHLGVALCWMLD